MNNKNSSSMQVPYNDVHQIVLVLCFKMLYLVWFCCVFTYELVTGNPCVYAPSYAISFELVH
jgi:hypothetical protein